MTDLKVALMTDIDHGTGFQAQLSAPHIAGHMTLSDEHIGRALL
ncbi:MAG: hypothetical protein AAF641_05035 [Pseudomonadota bacterium]